MISIVDDDESVREATKGLLQSHGYLAESYSAAEDFLGSGSVGNTLCLITDVRMPGLNGIELQRRLIEIGHRIPVIFITAKPDERTRLKALQAGACGFFGKPFSEEGLIDCLKKALRSTAGDS